MRLGSAVLLASSALVLAPAGAPAQQFSDRAEVERNRKTGKVGFVGTRPGRPIPRPGGFTASSPPAAVGRAYLEQHGPAFGLSRAAAVRATRTAEQPRGATAVRYQQSIDGVDVLGGEFVVQLDRANNVLSVLGEAEPAGEVDTEPALARQEAERTAIAHTARAESAHAARLEARDTALRIFDDRVMGGPGLGRPLLVWAVRVGDGLAVRRLVLVDADLGVVTASIDETPHARNRVICDAGNQRGVGLPCGAAQTVLTEGGTYGGSVPDLQKAYDYSGATYDYFFTRFGRDSLDGNGVPLTSTVRYCDPDTRLPCPDANAFWDPVQKQVVFGQGYAVDDIVAHELTHGLTQFTSNLFYYYQSGAINESLSDVFGELIDQVTDTGADAPPDKWLLGEDVGTIRDMQDPTSRGHPDSMTSSLFALDNDFVDAGGVHTNSGVNNKAAFLMSDGGSFGGQTITGIGADETARVYYAVQTGFLTSASDYKDLGLALGQACDNLVGTDGITTGDCEQVRKAVLATGMLTERPEATDEVECPPTQTATYVFEDDVEGPPRWTPSKAKRWYLNGPPFPYATSGVTSLYGENVTTTDEYSLVQIGSVPVPAGGFLSFAHAFRFDHDAEGTYDGGVVDYSTDGGSTWTNALPVGEYNGVIDTRYGNPLAGRSAFVGSSYGYRRSVAPLLAPAGSSIKLRFRIGTDSSMGDYGWFLDDIRIGSCGTPGQFAVDSGASSASEGSRAATLVVSRPSGQGGASVSVRTTGGTATPGVDYTALSTTVNFTGTQTSASVSLPVADDGAVDPGETIEFAIGDPRNGEITTATGTVTIQDNDTASNSPPGVQPPARLVLTVVGARATRTRVTLRFAVPAAGTLRVTGRARRVRFRAARATIAAARTLAVTLRIPRKLQRLLRKRSAIARFSASFQPAAGGDPLKVPVTVRLNRRR